MRAIQISELRQPLRAVSLPDPEPGPGEVRVRIEACGICHSDAHYRQGFGKLTLPRTPGHEVAGFVERCGPGVDLATGTRVALHYLISCGACDRCLGAGEQFCRRGEMIGKDRDGGYAEAIVVPARNAVPVPDNVPLPHAAVMMCSTATAFHAFRLAEMQAGQRVALLGFGGLGASALQLGRALGAAAIAAIDVVGEKLALAERQGAIGIDASRSDFPESLARFGGGHGIDIALDFAGRPETSAAVLRQLAPRGRLVIVALTREPPPFDPYRDLVGTEARIIGCSDHLRDELVELLQMASEGRIDLTAAVSATVPLEPGPINGVLDDLEHGTARLRTVIVR
jgi:propanol-preferring alcohol dehydrogenase